MHRAGAVSLAFVHAAGTPRAVGRAQGEAFAAGIHDSLAFYRRLAADDGGDLDALGAAAGPYLDAARDRVPDLVEELEGLVEGAGISRVEGLVLNCMEEVWDLEACTTMVHGDLFLHAEQWYAGHSAIGVVVARPDAGPAFVSPTCVGFLPAVGMSAAGFAQGIDSLRCTDERVGVARVLVSRLALGAPGLSGAVAAACSEGRAGGYAHVLATRHRSVAVETSATSLALVEGVAVHTNHYLSPRLRDVAAPPSEGSLTRLSSASRLLAEAPPRNLEDCPRLLADHAGRPDSTCAHGDGPEDTATVFAMACELTTGRMIVSDGPPCLGRWEEIAVPASRADARRVG